MGTLSFPWRVRGIAAVLVIPPLVGAMDFGRLAGWLGGSARATPGGAAADDAALAALVDRALRALPGVWRHTCLRRSAVLYYLLRRAGRPVELCIGVRRDGAGALAAHAWLVLAGRPYLEAASGPAPEHQVIARFPEPRPSRV